MRPTTNIHEEAFRKLAAKNGWRALHRGWPDFLCFNDKTKEIIAVEVKPRTESGRLEYLKQHQVQVMVALQQFGVRCFVSDGVRLEKFDRIRHGSGKWKRELEAKLAAETPAWIAQKQSNCETVQATAGVLPDQPRGG